MDLAKTIKAVIILDMDGMRVLAEYYDDQINAKQFERRLFSKTKSSKVKNHIINIDGRLAVHKFITGSHIYVVGGRYENPLILDSVLDCLCEVILSMAVNRAKDTTSGFETQDITRLIVALDEICADGIILETDPNLMMSRITSEIKEDAVESLARRIFQSLT